MSPSPSGVSLMPRQAPAGRQRQCPGESLARANLAIPTGRANGTVRGEIDPQKQQNCEGFSEMGHHGVAPKAGQSFSPASHLHSDRGAEIQITFFLSDKSFSYQEGIDFKFEKQPEVSVPSRDPHPLA